jgi:hypothetical protein
MPSCLVAVVANGQASKHAPAKVATIAIGTKESVMESR